MGKRSRLVWGCQRVSIRQWPPWYVLFVAVYVFPLLVLPARGEGSNSQEERKIRRFLERINTVRGGSTTTTIRSLINDIHAEWQSKKDTGYFHVVLALCDALSSANSAGDAFYKESRRSLAAEAVDTAGEKPIDTEVMLMLHLQDDWDYRRNEVAIDQWQADRQTRVRRWLKVWNRLREEKLRWEKKVGGPYRLNMRPPLGAMKDPALRKEYEDARAENSRRAEISQKKSNLKNLDSRFTASAKRYIVNTYSNPPFANEELEKLLTESGLDANTRAEIVNEVKKRQSTRKEQEAKQPPPPHMQFIENFTPPGAPTYHADPRLRVKVSFDLKSPLVEDVLHELRQAIKVNLTRADDIQNQYPAYNSLSYRNTPAWEVMDSLAKSQRVEGSWEKEGDGYRLVRNGNPLSIPEASQEGAGGSSSGSMLMLAVAALLLILGSGYWWVRRHRGRASASA